MPVCPICQAKLAESKNGYASHIERYHSNVTAKLHECGGPVNTSGRSKKQIVEDMENGPLAPFILLTGIEDRHLDACRCNRCFQAKLDALVTQSEESTNDLQSGIAGDIDGDELSASGGAN